MTSTMHIAGIFRACNHALAASDHFQHIFSRELGDPTFANDHVSLFGAYEDCWPGKCLLVSPEIVTAIVGEPVLHRGGSPVSRTRALALIGDDLRSGSHSCFAEAHGTYCGVSYNVLSRTLHLFTDKVGLRGMFFAEIDGLVLFSSDPGFLQNVLPERSEHNEAGILETLAFGYPLGDRTLLKVVKRLREAEVIKCNEVGCVREQYHRWSARIDCALDLTEAASRVYEAFKLAVEDRLALLPGSNNFAFLSGGMDSRLVVQTLCAFGRTPVTLNVAPVDTQDATFGNRAANYFKTVHFWRPATTETLGKSIDEGVEYVRTECSGEESRLWWSGDGGSVGLGHVYLTPASCVLVRKDPETIARALIDDNHWKVSERVFRADWRHLCEWPLKGVIEEVRRLHELPAEKRAYAFLMFNDQRRHLDHHFRKLDNRKFDLVLPFFDDRFIQVVLDTPIELLLGHKLYNVLVTKMFPPSHNVPWQAYPGHAPCPYKTDKMDRYQWDSWADHKSVRSAQRQAARNAFHMLIRSGIAPPVNGLFVVAAIVATYLGVRDMRYILKVATLLRSTMH